MYWLLLFVAQYDDWSQILIAMLIGIFVWIVSLKPHKLATSFYIGFEIALNDIGLRHYTYAK